jgi:hypothetical protein
MILLEIQNWEQLAVVDDEDFERLSQFKWYRCGTADRFTIRRLPWIDGRTKSISLASEVMNNIGKLYDHKDRNPLNNQKFNLREATYSQNAANVEKFGGTSKHKGVDYFKKYGKYRARISYNNRVYHLGFFDLEIDAALAYNARAVKLHGAFAVLNKI